MTIYPFSRCYEYHLLRDDGTLVSDKPVFVTSRDAALMNRVIRQRKGLEKWVRLNPAALINLLESFQQLEAQ